LTQREEDKRVRRGKAAAKGATVIFWRLAGGDEDDLLALRVLLLDLVAIFGFLKNRQIRPRTLSLAPEYSLEEMDNDGRRSDAEFNGNSTRYHSNTLHCRAQSHQQRLTTLHNVSCRFFRSFTRLFHPKVAQNPHEPTTQPIQGENKDPTSLFDYM
jgi:hypothetical protein